jgi:hypothetical protein
MDRELIDRAEEAARRGAAQAERIRQGLQRDTDEIRRQQQQRREETRPLRGGRR